MITGDEILDILNRDLDIYKRRVEFTKNTGDDSTVSKETREHYLDTDTTRINYITELIEHINELNDKQKES
jgi:hypothetical protein